MSRDGTWSFAISAGLLLVCPRLREAFALWRDEDGPGLGNVAHDRVEQVVEIHGALRESEDLLAKCLLALLVTGGIAERIVVDDMRPGRVVDHFDNLQVEWKKDAGVLVRSHSDLQSLAG